MEPVRWGVLGVAKIATGKVIPAMAGSELSRVHAIASRSGGRAEAAAADLGIAVHHDSYEALLADPDVEAVYIPLPNHLHPEWTLAAAEAGKHVLCEKPLATTAEDARRMIEGCRRAGVKLMEAFMYRLHPMWVEVQRMVASGLVGEVVTVQSVFSYRNLDPSDIRNIADAGGGALYDIGCYLVNVSRMLLGDEPDGVTAVIHRDDRFGTDATTSAILDFGGRHAVLTCSTQMARDQRVAIDGTAGRLVVDTPFTIPPDRPTRLLHVDESGRRTEVHEIGAADQYAVQADAFSRAIRHDTEVPTPPEDAVANLAVMERIFAAADRD